MQKLWGILFFAAGQFSIAGGVFNWDWFMESRKARIFVSMLERPGPRGFHALLGAGIASLGILGLLGFIDFSQKP